MEEHDQDFWSCVQGMHKNKGDKHACPSQICRGSDDRPGLGSRLWESRVSANRDTDACPNRDVQPHPNADAVTCDDDDVYPNGDAQPHPNAGADTYPYPNRGAQPNANAAPVPTGYRWAMASLPS
jgi:hypothetical protein